MAPEEDDSQPITAKAETRIIEHDGLGGSGGEFSRTKQYPSDPRTPRDDESDEG